MKIIMDEQYLYERLKEVRDRGYEQALATIEDDFEEDIIDQIDEETYKDYCSFVAVKERIEYEDALGEDWWDYEKDGESISKGITYEEAKAIIDKAEIEMEDV